ncbi:interferon regulatory factor 7 isoform X1 [Ascaphus truei]|uniref:interferon regulatory factor 7 isoform X1 n=2 Tax=Ascaphus truei TaxID=8439 RepID=UPI003F5AA4C5
MHGRERVHHKELFGPWLLRQIRSEQFGVCWLEEESNKFRIPWKHLNRKPIVEQDYEIFKAWAIESGKYYENNEDPAKWKTNFRCALNGVTCGDVKMFSEVQDNSGDEKDPHKIYQVNQSFPAVPLTPALRTAVSNVAPAAEQHPNKTDQDDDDEKLLISPDNIRALPFNVVQGQNTESLAALWKNALVLDPGDAADMPIPTLQPVHFSESAQPCFIPLEGNPTPNGCFIDHAAWMPIKIHETQLQMYKPSQNGHPQDYPLVDRVFQPLHDATHQVTDEYWTNQASVKPIPPVLNGFGTPHPEQQPPQTHPIPYQLQGVIPHITSWDITVYYKGCEVLKQSVTRKFIIRHTGNGDPELGPVDIVRFPPTENLADQKQLQYTNTIMESVGGGLLLEVNPQDYKLYAKRLGKANVFWDFSKELETGECETYKSNFLQRETQTEIFDFSRFWEEVRAYKANQRPSSPDYTIYLCFGQDLRRPKERKLVLVKLVPQFCVYCHELVQREGASSLNGENISLQISNGNSLSLPDFLDPQYFMDIDMAIDFSSLL